MKKKSDANFARAEKHKRVSIKFHELELLEEGKARVQKDRLVFWLSKWKSTFHHHGIRK